MLSPSIEKTQSLWMSFSLNHNHASLHPKLLFKGESKIEDDFFTPLPVPTLMLEPKQQQLTNESPTEPTDKPSVPPVEESRVYSRR
jgi:hypothetical protein